jgi:hypothetical protein
VTHGIRRALLGYPGSPEVVGRRDVEKKDSFFYHAHYCGFCGEEDKWVLMYSEGTLGGQRGHYHS